MDQQGISQLEMAQERTAENRAHAAVLWQQARVWATRVPTKAWVVFVLFLLAAVLMAMHTAFAGKDASLRLKVQHSLRSAQLSIWVDGDLAYSGKLIGLARKKFGLLPEVAGSLSETLPVSSGTHQLRVRLASDDGTVQEDPPQRYLPRLARRTQRRGRGCILQHGMDQPLRRHAAAHHRRLHHLRRHRIRHPRASQTDRCSPKRSTQGLAHTLRASPGANDVTM